MADKTQELYFDVWATAWGPVGAVASPAGIVRFVLPHYQVDELLQLLAWEHRGARRDPTPFEALVPLTRDYFNGKCVDFAAVICDLPGEGTFGGKVLRACRAIPFGQTRTYLQLATTISKPDGARAVANALGKNCIPLVVPCHRVVYSGGGMGGFSAPGGVELKQRMLAMEKKSMSIH